MDSTTSLQTIRSLESPFPGRTCISIYSPKAPVKLIAKQIQSELIRSEKSTNWRIKGAVVMMLNQILTFLENLSQDEIPPAGFVLFAVPKNEHKAIIHHLQPDKESIVLFFYVLDERFYIKEELFNFS